MEDDALEPADDVLAVDGGGLLEFLAADAEVFADLGALEHFPGSLVGLGVAVAGFAQGFGGIHAGEVEVGEFALLGEEVVFVFS